MYIQNSDGDRICKLNDLRLKTTYKKKEGVNFTNNDSINEESIEIVYKLFIDNTLMGKYVGRKNRNKLMDMIITALNENQNLFRLPTNEELTQNND